MHIESCIAHEQRAFTMQWKLLDFKIHVRLKRAGCLLCRILGTMPDDTPAGCSPARCASHHCRFYGEPDTGSGPYSIPEMGAVIHSCSALAAHDKVITPFCLANCSGRLGIRFSLNPIIRCYEGLESLHTQTCGYVALHSVHSL